MPIRQTGNWSPEVTSAVGVDLIDVPLRNGTIMNFALLGGAPLWATTYTWWAGQNGTGVNSGWRAVPAVSSGQVRVLDGTNNFEDQSMYHKLQMVSLNAFRGAAGFGDIPPSVRCRVDVVAQLFPFNGIPANGMRFGIDQGNNNTPLVNNSFAALRVGVAGTYTHTERHQSGAAVVATPVSGAVSALVPHILSIELINGPLNSLKLSANGTLLYKEESGAALFTDAGGISDIREPWVVFGKKGDAGIVVPSKWAVFSTRIRYDYV